MAHQVPWDKVILERFIELALLTEDEEKVMRLRVAGKTRQEQSDIVSLSVSQIDRIIARLKKKYDAVQKYDPILPPRERFHEMLPKI